MPIATKNGSIIVKDGAVAENCDCCGGWYCYTPNPDGCFTEPCAGCEYNWPASATYIATASFYAKVRRCQGTSIFPTTPWTEVSASNLQAPLSLRLQGNRPEGSILATGFNVYNAGAVYAEWGVTVGCYETTGGTECGPDGIVNLSPNGLFGGFSLNRLIAGGHEYAISGTRKMAQAVVKGVPCSESKSIRGMTFSLFYCGSVRDCDQITNPLAGFTGIFADFRATVTVS